MENLITRFAQILGARQYSGRSRYFTCPFLIGLFYGFGLLPLEANGWNQIGGVTSVGEEPTAAGQLR